MNNMGFFKNKWVRLILAIDAVMILAIIGMVILDIAKNSVIYLNVTPVDAIISIDGRTEVTNGMYAIMPGTHEITIAREGLESKTFTIDIAPDYVVEFTTFLKGEGDNFDFYKLIPNYNSYLKLVEIASVGNNRTTDEDFSAEPFIVDFERVLSITDDLPIKGWVYGAPAGTGNGATAMFAIQNGINMKECEIISCLLVNYDGTDFEEEVIKSIEDAGYDPLDYQIIYKRFKHRDWSN